MAAKNFKRNLPTGGTLTRILWFLVLGAVLCFFPRLSSNIICYIGGGMLIVYGAVNILRYFKKGVEMSGNPFSLGLIAVAGGLVLVLMPQVLASILPLLMGFALIACGVLQLEMAISLSRMRHPRWFLPLASSILLLILGVVILVNPFATSLVLIRFIGISMLIEAVCDLYNEIAFKKARKAYMDSRVFPAK